MRTFGKMLAWFIGIIILLYIIMWIVLHYIIRPATYKSLIESAMYNATGHEMVINGQFRWSIFPNPSVKITDVLIKNKNDDQSGSPYFAKINEANLQMSFSSLFSSKIMPKKIILRDSDINIISKGAQHAINTAEPMSSTAAQATTSTNLSSSPSFTTLSQLPQITVFNTTINWINPQQNKTIHFNDVNLTVLPSADSVWIKGDFQVANAKKLTKLNLSTSVINRNNTQVTLKDLKLDSTTLFNNTMNSFSYRGDLTIDFINQTISVPNYTLNWNDLPLSGSSSNNWKVINTGLVINFTTSLNTAGGLVHETGVFTVPDNGANSINYKITVSHIQLAPILKACHHDNLVKGTADLNATLTSTNANQDWIANLNGQGNFKLTNTQLGTFNFENYINQALALLHDKPLQNNGAATVFSTSTGTFSIRNGVFYNNDLRMNASDFTSTGSGNINLNTNTINYLITLQQASNKDFNLPVSITGNLQQPLVKVDLNKLSKVIIKNTLKEKGQQLKKLFHDQGVDLKKIF